MHCIIMMTWCMQVKVVTSVEERRRILRSCHSDPTSGHFGVTKTFRRVAERFYWRGTHWWYHISCVRVPQNALDDTSIPWYCKQCQRYV